MWKIAQLKRNGCWSNFCSFCVFILSQFFAKWLWLLPEWQLIPENNHNFNFPNKHKWQTSFPTLASTNMWHLCALVVCDAFCCPKTLWESSSSYISLGYYHPTVSPQPSIYWYTPPFSVRTRKFAFYSEIRLKLLVFCGIVSLCVPHRCLSRKMEITIKNSCWFYVCKRTHCHLVRLNSCHSKFPLRAFLS